MLGVILGLAVALAVHFHTNFHAVVPGLVFRSAQLDPVALDDFIQRYPPRRIGIRRNGPFPAAAASASSTCPRIPGPR